jgi:hypothetical protein
MLQVRQVHRGEPPGRQRFYTRVQPFDGTWTVTTLVVEKAGTC